MFRQAFYIIPAEAEGYVVFNPSMRMAGAGFDTSTILFAGPLRDCLNYIGKRYDALNQGLPDAKPS